MFQNQKFMAKHMFLNKAINKCNAENMVQHWKFGDLINSEFDELRAGYLAQQQMTSCYEFLSVADMFSHGIVTKRVVADLASGQKMMTANEIAQAGYPPRCNPHHSHIMNHQDTLWRWAR